MIHRDLCQAFPHVQFRRWRGADASPVFTAKSDITIYLKAITEYAEQTYMPVGLLVEDGKLNVTLEVSMNVSGSGRRKASVRQQWDSMTRSGVIAVPGLGNMATSDSAGKWFVWRREVAATKEQVHSQLLDAGKAVLKHMEAFFSVE